MASWHCNAMCIIRAKMLACFEWKRKNKEIKRAEFLPSFFTLQYNENCVQFPAISYISHLSLVIAELHSLALLHRRYCLLDTYSTRYYYPHLLLLRIQQEALHSCLHGQQHRQAAATE